ncbi:MAG: type II toxin-antitoxin system death-on-curing family toxin [Rhizobium sp.]|nr:type II toxin-antitoxin system death-on-curing family toxin [Rhizobium sp.]MCZ8350242.1 type II toxin-antitoxin system death-on-curing family toxin [Rhizobium sp.]
MSEPLWIAIEDVIAINRRLLLGTSENHFLRDRSALEGALHRPRFQAEYRQISSVSWLASCIIQSIGKAHAFEQGNKRTAWLAGRYFIAINGYRLLLDAEQQERLKYVIEALIIGNDDPSLLADRLEPLLSPA